MTPRRGAFVVAALVLAASPAFADDSEVPPSTLVAEPPRAAAGPPPPFVLADHFATPRLLNLDVNLLVPEIADWGLRLDVQAQWTGRLGLGVYGAYAVTHVSNSNTNVNEIFETSIDRPLGARTAGSNVELGGTFALSRLTGVPVTLHVGVVTPLGASPTEGVNFIANLLTAEMRISDLERYTFDSWWLRGGATAAGRFGAFSWQVDVSASTGFPTEDYLETFPIAHLNVGIGARLAERWVALAELASIAIFRDDETALKHEAGLALRVMFGQTSLHAGVLLPFDDDGGAGQAIVMGVARTY